MERHLTDALVVVRADALYLRRKCSRLFDCFIGAPATAAQQYICTETYYAVVMAHWCGLAGVVTSWRKLQYLPSDVLALALGTAALGEAMLLSVPVLGLPVQVAEHVGTFLAVAAFLCLQLWVVKALLFPGTVLSDLMDPRPNGALLVCGPMALMSIATITATSSGFSEDVALYLHTSSLNSLALALHLLLTLIFTVQRLRQWGQTATRRWTSITPAYLLPYCGSLQGLICSADLAVSPTQIQVVGAAALVGTALAAMLVGYRLAAFAELEKHLRPTLAFLQVPGSLMLSAWISSGAPGGGVLLRSTEGTVTHALLAVAMGSAAVVWRQGLHLLGGREGEGLRPSAAWACYCFPAAAHASAMLRYATLHWDLPGDVRAATRWSLEPGPVLAGEGGAGAGWAQALTTLLLAAALAVVVHVWAVYILMAWRGELLVAYDVYDPGQHFAQVVKGDQDSDTGHFAVWESRGWQAPVGGDDSSTQGKRCSERYGSGSERDNVDQTVKNADARLREYARNCTQEP